MQLGEKAFRLALYMSEYEAKALILSWSSKLTKVACWEVAGSLHVFGLMIAKWKPSCCRVLHAVCQQRKRVCNGEYLGQ